MSDENKTVEPEIIEPQTVDVKSETSREVMISFEKDGLVAFQNHNELSNAAKLLVQLEMAPEHLRKIGFKAVASAMIFCQQHKLPYSAMNEISFIKGKLGVYGALYTALAKRAPDYGEMVVLYVDKEMTIISLDNKNLDKEIYACVIKYKKLKDESWHEYFFTWDEAVKSGQTSNAVYGKYRKDMLYHNAKRRCLNVEHPDYLKGVESAEVLNFQAMAQGPSRIDQLNEKYGLKERDITPQEEG